MKEKDRAKMCRDCGARCCRYVAERISRPNTKTEYDNIRWHLMHRNVVVYIDNDGDWMLEFQAPCENLKSDNTCAIYETRPRVCRDYPGADQFCVYETDESPYREVFYTPREFEKYLERKGIDWKWKTVSA